MSQVCGIIAPRQEEMTGYDDARSRSLASCILEGVHGWGPHVFRTPEGGLIAWEDDNDCGCCEPDEDDRCTVYWDIKESDIPKYQDGGPPRK